jgi:hypothetical protein
MEKYKASIVQHVVTFVKLLLNTFITKQTNKKLKRNLKVI